MKKFPLDLSKFKKISSDQHTTTLEHPHGHQIKIAHDKIDSKMKQKLAALPALDKMADGGKVADKKLQIRTKESQASGVRADSDMPKETRMMADGGEALVPPIQQDSGPTIPQMHDKKQDGGGMETIMKLAPLLLAKGGEIDKKEADAMLAKKAAIDKINKEHFEKGEEQEEEPADLQTYEAAHMMAHGGYANNPKLQQAYKKYDIGGMVSDNPYKKAGSTINKTTKENEKYETFKKNNPFTKGYADGGEVDSEQSSSQPQAPVTINIASPGQMQPVPPALQKAPISEPAPSPQDINYPALIQKEQADQAPYIMPQHQAEMAPQQPMPARAPMSTTNEQAPIAPMAPEESNEPTLMGGYEKQQKGIDLEAQAAAQEGRKEAAALDRDASKIQQQIDQFHENYRALNDERANLLSDIQNGHIDPENYWKDHSKVMTGIGLILAGFNPTNRPNAALEFLNAQMDRNLRGQQAEMDKKNNLLRANFEQSRDLESAVNMTRIMQNDILSAELKKAAAVSKDPLARARALQLSGQLDQQIAPLVQQQAIRQTLQQASAASTDPASYVAAVVPKEQQKEVFKEIKDAQNASHSEAEIMKTFDEANKHNTIAQRAAHAGAEPGSVLKLKALFLPMIHDAEGRVNEYEAKTLYDLIPAPGDLPAKVEAKKQALKAFIHQKMAAPTAKGFGIDLDKFRSTSANPEMKLNPQQQSFAKWAKANPEDPRAKIVLKKLGIE